MLISNSVDLARALQAYGNKRGKAGDDISDTSSVNDLLVLRELRKGSFNNLFPVMFSIHGLDINTAIQRAIDNGGISDRAGKLAVIAMNRAMDRLANKYSVLTESTFNEVKAEFELFVQTFNENDDGRVDLAKFNRMDAIYNRIKAKFKDPLVVQYSIGTNNSASSLKLAFTSFINLRGQVNAVIKTCINEVLKENKVTNSKLSDSNYLTTDVFNWGHTQVEGTDVSQIISGKLFAEMLSADHLIKDSASRENVFRAVTQDFIENAGHQHTKIRLHRGNISKGDPKVLRLVIESGFFQSAIVQNETENKHEIGPLERKWSLLGALERNSRLLQDGFGVSSVGELVKKLLNLRSSPTIIENIVSTLVAKLRGKKDTGDVGAKIVSLLDQKIAVKKKRIKIELQNKAKTASTLKASQPLRTLQGRFTSTANIQQIINQQLAQRIKDNMGDGTRKDILNLRTGRFAESVSVDRVTSSKAGMLTAFYTYMRNPYGTFSKGGQQQFPTTRDPKLLISKSIHDIAAKLVNNRMRAVLV